MGPRDSVRAAFGEPGRTRSGANRVGRFLYQQRLVAMQCVQASQAALQVLLELAGRDLHQPNGST